MFQCYSTGLIREPGSPAEGYLCQLPDSLSQQVTLRTHLLFHYYIRWFARLKFINYLPLSPSQLPENTKQESAKDLWVTEADLLENTPEVALESWKFYPVFHTHSTATSANLPLDRTSMQTDFPIPWMVSVRRFWYTDCSLMEYLNPNTTSHHRYQHSSCTDKTSIADRTLPISVALSLHQLKLLTDSNKDTERQED